MNPLDMISTEDRTRIEKLVKALTEIQQAKHVESFIERALPAMAGLMLLGSSVDYLCNTCGEENGTDAIAMFMSLYAGAIYSDGIKGTNYGTELAELLKGLGETVTKEETE